MFFTLDTSVMWFTKGMYLHVSSVIFFYDNFKTKRKNILLPETGSGGYLRLSSIGAPRWLGQLSVRLLILAQVMISRFVD